MGETIESKSPVIDNLNKLVFYFERDKSFEPSYIIMHPMDHYKFVNEFLYFYGIMQNSDYLIWQGIPILRSYDVKENEPIII